MAIVNVNYGHQGSGKTYSYYDPYGTRRAGDEVVVKVTNKKGTTYKTMGVIRSTHGSGTAGEALTRDFLEDNNIGLKTVLGGSQTQLPGYYKGWDKDAKERYDTDVKKRLGFA